MKIGPTPTLILHQAEKRVTFSASVGTPLAQTASASTTSPAAGAPSSSATTSVTQASTAALVDGSPAPKIDLLGGLENDPFGEWIRGSDCMCHFGAGFSLKWASHTLV